ncbi:MAG: DUF1156 domain-containing protein [Vicinamibacterales bacterium]
MTQDQVIAKKKLIEVALPLDAINKASAREKSIRHGHPSTLHLWWARRPLAAARAVIFAQMVDDPSANPDLFPTEKAQEKERQRLFKIIEDLVLWENTTNDVVLDRAREEIWQSWRRACAENADHPRAREIFNRNVLPAFHDPFAGGGSLPLEAQRLGLEAHASDLNPVAVLINKAMIEIPPKFAGKPPVNPKSRANPRMMGEAWRGAQGLAEDVRYYGQWMRDEAERRIGHLYPKVRVTAEMARERPDLEPYVGRELTVIAWLWARTVKSPNPAFRDVDVPLASTFLLAAKTGREVYVEPQIEASSYRFTLKVGGLKDLESAKLGTGAGKRAGFRCLMSGTPITYEYVRHEGAAGRMGVRLMAVVAEGDRTRLYLEPSADQEAIARSATPQWTPDVRLEGKSRVNVSNYGLDTYADLFTSRQLVVLATLSDLVAEVRGRVRNDAAEVAFDDDGLMLHDGGTGVTGYSDAVATYLGIAVSRFADRNNSLCVWDSGPTGTKSSTGGSARTASIRNLFSRQAIPMVWDFAEANPFSESGGSYASAAEWIVPAIRALSGVIPGHAQQGNAATQSVSAMKVVSTDPPYYDNIDYADLADFFYVWLRRSFAGLFPELFGTLAVPKSEELVATPFRHGSKAEAETFFLDGMTRAMGRLAVQAHPGFPITIYYAFKQSETENTEGTASTGWETFLAAVIAAGFALTGTWPMRTELSNRMIGSGTNALASSIILVCRPRPTNAPSATRRDFQEALRTELPSALAHLQRSNIAPVDLAQASIGPGMGVFTRYREVLNADGTKMSVRDALTLINATLDEVLAEQEGDFDSESRWALAWFNDWGFGEGPFGDAHTYFLRYNTAENALKEAGLVESGRGKVRLFKPSELDPGWDPETDTRLTVWDMTHHLIRALEAGGEPAAAAIASKIGSKAEAARELAYRLYVISERKKRAQDALAYNGLVQSWPEIVRLAREQASAVPVEQQAALGLDGA